MIDHINVRVSDIARSTAWYSAALASLGYVVTYDFPFSEKRKTATVGFGIGNRTELWISQAPGQPAPIAPVHIALGVPNRGLVHDFHAASLAAGGRDNGAPGLRPQYTPTYYGGFVLDPDGHNVEAVCREAE